MDVAPRCSLHLFGLYTRESSINKRGQTTNAEAAFRKLHSELSMCHPTIWKFIDQLRTLQKGSDQSYEEAIAGMPRAKKLKRYQDADRRIFEIATAYKKRTPIEFLKAVASNYAIIE